MRSVCRNLRLFNYLYGRGDWIRTSDLLLPKQALYRAKLRPADSYGPHDPRYAPRGTRTPNLLIRSQMLYPIELWAQRSRLYHTNLRQNRVVVENIRPAGGEQPSAVFCVLIARLLGPARFGSCAIWVLRSLGPALFCSHKKPRLLSEAGRQGWAVQDSNL